MLFTFDKDVLDEDEQTLSSYGIEEESRLEVEYSNMKIRDIGSLGLRFMDVSNSQGLKRREWSRTAPRWRRTRCGLCLEGKCTNSRCEAYNQIVIIPIGYKKFDVLLDSDDTTTVCPICKNYVQPSSCAFNNCWWRFEGRKLEANSNGRPPKKCSSEWTQVDDAYHYFEELKSGTVTWMQLILEAVKNKPV
ncbi:unnamed protein product [Rotaria sp. Silwood1]|nr:unnamed protein product [Rotaria sp. Silwood1]CAF1310786.1 unnamed protein product [Rotaria sp. Silwood1]CAF3544768.1 unnamed protein product [Rotaria sp. Silwood1]CAF3559996.1 unnamed protein product [Rotaria sp. Silwood1]CAF5030824.1 unnamed protein product [Rotaria sp. Silwood1]